MLNLEIGNKVGIVLLTKDDQVLLKFTTGMPPMSGAINVLKYVFRFAVACKADKAMPCTELILSVKLILLYLNLDYIY